MSQAPLTIVRQRREDILSEIKSLRERIDILESELPDLEVTERTLARLAGQKTDQMLHYRLANGPPVLTSVLPTDGTGKPAGTPTMPQMIMTLLQEAREKGVDGLEPREMTEQVASRWWPNVKSDEVGPIAWRMWNRKQLCKEGSRYSLLPETTEAAETSEKEDTTAS